MGHDSFIWDMTHSYGPWLIHMGRILSLRLTIIQNKHTSCVMWDMTRSYTLTYDCDMTHSHMSATWLTHWSFWHDSCICTHVWLQHDPLTYECDMTHSHALTYACDVTHSHMNATRLTHIWGRHDSSRSLSLLFVLCVMWDMTRSSTKTKSNPRTLQQRATRSYTKTKSKDIMR